MIDWLLNHSYFVHFIGGFLIFFIMLLRYKKNKIALETVFWVALFFEIAQFEIFWRVNNYTWQALLNYEWLDTLIDLVATLAGAAGMMAIQKKSIR